MSTIPVHAPITAASSLAVAQVSPARYQVAHPVCVQRRSFSTLIVTVALLNLICASPVLTLFCDNTQHQRLRFSVLLIRQRLSHCARVPASGLIPPAKPRPTVDAYDSYLDHPSSFSTRRRWLL
jgi:hypothetical protein